MLGGAGGQGHSMCRNIHILFNFDPPATDEEIHAAALQYVRKVSGSTRPSQVNEAPFQRAVAQVAAATAQLLDSMTTSAAPRNRDVEAQKARERAARRFGTTPA
jgi:hypothetical protein